MLATLVTVDFCLTAVRRALVDAVSDEVWQARLRRLNIVRQPGNIGSTGFLLEYRRARGLLI